MNTKQYRGSWSMLLLISLTACAGETGHSSSNASDNNASGDMPSIHYVQESEYQVDGVNQQRNFYIKAIDACKAAGFPLHALTEKEVALIGVTRHEAWLDSQQETVRSQSWDYAVDGGAANGCMFSLEMRGEQVTTSDRKTVSTDLATGNRSEEPAEENALLRVAIDPAETSAATESANRVHGPVKRTIMGQPCNEWIVEIAGKVRQCVWSAGGEWGFDPSFSTAPESSSGQIVLSSEPLKIDGHSAGIRLTTIAFTVGKSFADKAMEIPAAGALP